MTTILYNPLEFNFYYENNILKNVECPRYPTSQTPLIVEDSSVRTISFSRFYFFTSGHFYQRDQDGVLYYVDGLSGIRNSPLSVFGEYGTHQIFILFFDIPGVFTILHEYPQTTSSPSSFFIINTVCSIAA
jgi:hypothetical protein